MKRLALIVLIAFAASAGSKLAWDASPSPDVLGYRVFRSNDGTNWVYMGCTSSNVLEFPIDKSWCNTWASATATNACCESDFAVPLLIPKPLPSGKVKVQ
jgi:hypothetical protein